MIISVESCLLIIFVLFYLNIVYIFNLIIKRLKADNNEDTKKKRMKTFIKEISRDRIFKKKVFSTTNYYSLKEQVVLDKDKVVKVAKHIRLSRDKKKYIRRINSFSRYKRIEAAIKLGKIGGKTARLVLEKALLKEKSYPVKLYIANSLSEIGDKNSIKVLVESLLTAHRWYREKVNMLIADFGEAFNEYLPNIINSNSMEIKELIIDFSEIYYSKTTKEYLINFIASREENIEKLDKYFAPVEGECCANCKKCVEGSTDTKRLCKYKGEVRHNFICNKYGRLPSSLFIKSNYDKLSYKAADILRAVYPKILEEDLYLTSKDSTLKNIAVKSLGNYNSIAAIENLKNYLKDSDTVRSAVYAISLIIERNPSFINYIIKSFSNETDLIIKKGLTEVLANRIEYFVMKLISKEKAIAKEVVKEVLLLGKSNEIISFLNKNKNLDLENELISIIKESLEQDKSQAKDFSKYLNPRLAKKCKLEAYTEKMNKKEEKKDKKLIITLYFYLFTSLLMPCLLYFVNNYGILNLYPIKEQLKIFVIDFNYYLVFYSLTINLIYLLLVILSSINAKKRLKLWKVKTDTFLFKKKMLPSISIIAPAYNEAKTIIESTNSLLNLKYPEYELIIVNDGSKDSTLDSLINNYDLERVDYIFEEKLMTKAVRGIYINRSLPKLIVVDKENGGKADSLNTGINISNKEYFCGIDADSLLEEEALLKLAALTLDEGVETPALGGNIFPINGCSVEKGSITKIKLPKSRIAKLQTIEYIRAFMAGRLGWAYTNTLLIISGAFGLFRKERVISVGGYLTSSGKYAKDTVGEDMELVVRISRLMREKGLKYRIGYAFNANCWTEVPEDLGTLKKQRYRWHKGLIDILTFHKTMLFNPTYGRVGMVALPYFFIFEMIGPLVEIEGYFMVSLAFLLGILNAKLALLLLITTILMGVLISITSLLISEKDKRKFSLGDIMILIFYCVIENLGPRQLISFWRVGGYLDMIRKQDGWEKSERKGFNAENTEKV